MSQLGIGERAPWGGFPQVIRNAGLGVLKNEPEYQAAKSGSMPAAIELVDRLLTSETVGKIKEQIRDNKPLLLPVLAVEAAGKNKIPLAMAEVLGYRLGLDVESDILQQDKIGRTNAGADHRLAFNPTFRGDVKQGQKYLVLDDTLTMGGTIASLRGYVENRGGQVVAASVMTAHEGALNLPVKPTMLAAIENKHGPDMNQFWKETFGYGIDKLTQGEAGHLKSAKTIDAIRDRITAARHEGIKRLGAGRVEAPPRAKSVGESGLTGEALVSASQGLQVEQQAMIGGASVEQSYQETLAMYVQAKHSKADSIENRLESLISQQQARLQKTQSNRPGFFAAPGARKEWQAAQAQQQGRLQALHARLETVREIKEGMGLQSPRIEEMATRKMRAENPELAADWDAMKQAGRRQALEQKRKQKHSQEKSKGLSRGLHRSRE